VTAPATPTIAESIAAGHDEAWIGCQNINCARTSAVKLRDLPGYLTLQGAARRMRCEVCDHRGASAVIDRPRGARWGDKQE
jgi:hypothetical protein